MIEYHCGISLSDPYWHIFYALCIRLRYAFLKYNKKYNNVIKNCWKRIPISLFLNYKTVYLCTFLLLTTVANFLLGYMLNSYWFVFFVCLKFCICIWPFTFSIYFWITTIGDCTKCICYLLLSANTKTL